MDLWEWNLSLLIFVCYINFHWRTSTRRNFCTTDDSSNGYQPASDLGHPNVNTRSLNRIIIMTGMEAMYMPRITGTFYLCWSSCCHCRMSQVSAIETNSESLIWFQLLRTPINHMMANCLEQTSSNWCRPRVNMWSWYEFSFSADSTSTGKTIQELTECVT